MLKSGEIEVTFLLPNFTSLLQQMDQEVLEFFKRHYRKRLLSSILFECTESESVKGTSREIIMKYVWYQCAESWNETCSIGEYNLSGFMMACTHRELYKTVSPKANCHFVRVWHCTLSRAFETSNVLDETHNWLTMLFRFAGNIA